MSIRIEVKVVTLEKHFDKFCVIEREDFTADMNSKDLETIDNELADFLGLNPADPLFIANYLDQTYIDAVEFEYLLNSKGFAPVRTSEYLVHGQKIQFTLKEVL